MPVSRRRSTNVPSRQFRHCNQAKLVGFNTTSSMVMGPVGTTLKKNKKGGRRQSLLQPRHQTESCPVISLDNDNNVSQELTLLAAATPTNLLRRRSSSMDDAEKLLRLSTKVHVPRNSFDPFADPEEDLLEDQEDEQHLKREMRDRSRACRRHSIADHAPRALDSYAAASLYLPTAWSRFE